MELAIVRELELKVLETSQQLIALTNTCAELDWYVYLILVISNL